MVIPNDVSRSNARAFLQRYTDLEDKMNQFAADHLGEAFRSMRSVNALATHPDFQRRGYGGALVDAITSLADAEGRSTYLFSSNPINTEFYNSHGFFTLAELMVGDDDPTWKKPPVPIALVSTSQINSCLRCS